MIGFNISPEDIIQAEGVDATFQCQYIGASVVGWVFNGTSIHSRLPSNVSQSILDESIYMLTVLALPEYNRTQVWCVATIFPAETESTGPRVEFSSKGMLTVQG